MKSGIGEGQGTGHQKPELLLGFREDTGEPELRGIGAVLIGARHRATSEAMPLRTATDIYSYHSPFVGRPAYGSALFIANPDTPMV